jgi:hypothetical protein
MSKEPEAAAVLRERPAFVTRKSALHMLGLPADSRRRNYEIEEDLAPAYDPSFDACTDTDRDWIPPVIVSDWCPFEGRFCAVAEYVPYPHPPLGGVGPSEAEHTAIPWRSWEPGMVVRVRR